MIKTISKLFHLIAESGRLYIELRLEWKKYSAITGCNNIKNINIYI